MSQTRIEPLKKSEGITKAAKKLKIMRNVLCVGPDDTLTAVVCRGVMEQTFNEVDPGCRIKFTSAGYAEQPGKPASDKAKAVLRNFGHFISGHKSRSVADLNLEQFDTIVCVHPDVYAYVLSNPKVDQSSTQVILVEKIHGYDDLFDRGVERTQSTVNMAANLMRQFFYGLAKTHLAIQSAEN